MMQISMTIVAERAGAPKDVGMVQCAMRMRPRAMRPLLLPHDRKRLVPLPSFPRRRKERLRSDHGNREKTLRCKVRRFSVKKTPREGEKKSNGIRVTPFGDHPKA